MRAESVQILPKGTKALRVYLSVRDQITVGDLRDGETLPSEQKLAEAFGCQSSHCPSRAGRTGAGRLHRAPGWKRNEGSRAPSSGPARCHEF